MAKPGDVLTLRETNEPVEIVAVLDAAGTLLVRAAGEEPFQVERAQLESPREKHGGCGCCG